MRKSTGIRKIVAYMVWGNSHKEQPGWKTCPAEKVIIDGFSNDFAAVDFREELCHPTPPEKAKFGDC